MATTRYESVSGFAAWTFVKIAAAAIAVFVIVRIAIPDLINAHRTPYLWLAVACGLLVPIIIGWAAASVWRGIGRFRRRNLLIPGRDRP